MFSFTEIFIVLVIAFVVLGPEQFPKAVKKFLQFINELRTTVFSVKQDLSQIQSEANKALSKDHLDSTFKEVENEVQKQAKDLKSTDQTIKSTLDSLENFKK